MILRWIVRKLNQKREKERQKVIALRWEQAMLQTKLDRAKQEKNN